MTDETARDFSRRSILKALGVGGFAMAASPMFGGTANAASDASDASDGALSGAASTTESISAVAPLNPRVAGLHLQFGADASREVTVSWHSLQPVSNPRVAFAHLGRTPGEPVPAETVSYVDGKSGQTVYAHHVRLRDLRADREYLYAAVHDGAAPDLSTFRTAPRGRSPFTFTSFGDQGTPTLGKRYTPPAGVTIANPPFVNDNLGSPAAGDTTAGVERIQPLFHLFNGDLCYANLATDRVRTWSDFWENNTRSARHRPWMPAAGNHEIESGNGAIGFSAYQTYFRVPEADGQSEATRGLWYSFTVGSVRFISLNNDDVCYQDGGDIYVRGYSAGAQKRWLERELAAARRDRDVDWVIVCMHQVVVSTAEKFNGADLGIRQEWVPLFDKYNVDLVVCGHEHHYERSHPIRGQQPNATLTPIPTSTRTDVIDTTLGTVHMVLGGGGTAVPSNQLLFNPPACRVITGVGDINPVTHKHPPVYVTEEAPWSAVRDDAHSYGFASFAVDPGTKASGVTTIGVTYWEVTGVDGELTPFETFQLTRPRSDA